MTTDWLRIMFSKNLKQFEIRHVLVGTVLVAGAMGLIATQWYLAMLLGILILVGIVGGSFSYGLMFISDLIDDRRIDDRNRRSRFFNCSGLLILLVTAVSVVLLGLGWMVLTVFWLLEKVP